MHGMNFVSPQQVLVVEEAPQNMVFSWKSWFLPSWSVRYELKTDQNLKTFKTPLQNTFVCLLAKYQPKPIKIQQMGAMIVFNRLSTLLS